MELNDRVSFARRFASALHRDKGQTYDGKPYSRHLDDVVGVLLAYDIIDKDMLAAGYLHDVVEDTGVPMIVIEQLFGPGVANLVAAVTDQPGPNRKTRKALTYPIIRSTPGAVMLKLADRIANVQHSIDTKNLRMQKMYKKEFPEFSAALRKLGELEDVWGHLQSLHLRCT